MLFWLIAILLTAVVCAMLYGAAVRRPGTVEAGSSNATTNHFRLHLAEINADAAAGKLGSSEALAAKGELAREVLRLEAEEKRTIPTSLKAGRGVILVSALAVAALSLGTYAILGRPDVPNLPLAARPEIVAQSIDLNDAIGRIERQLETAPDDVRGWTVIAPAYMQLGRYADAERAYRRILELSPPTADAETNLAEAMMAQRAGDASGEPLALLQSAAARDPTHIPSRFYIAGEAMRAGDNPAAIAAWNALLALAKGDEPWVQSAREGLAVASGQPITLPDATSPEDTAFIRSMVDGLDARLASAGGSVEEWTQLVRAHLVLGEKPQAQAAMDRAIAAYPKAFDRGGLDAIALAGGLVLNGDQS